jgi:uncharacterized protein (DUF58 family)
MNSQIRSKIKKITIFTKRLTSSSLSGDYLSAFKGRGLEFDQLREYFIGDDVRFIDWKSSAKMNKMMVKEFIEERDRTIIIAIDVSASSAFSSQEELRKDTIAQVAATLTFVATHNKDKVGALFFSDQIEKWIPPKRGRAHVGAIMETLFTLKPKHKKTNIAQALRFLATIKKRNAIAFMLSDWIDQVNHYSNLLKVASIKFDFVGIRFLDLCEQKLPAYGFINVENPETGIITTIDTRKHSNTHLLAYKLEQEKLFKKYKIDLFDITVGKPFINKMIEFFHQRIRRQI